MSKSSRIAARNNANTSAVLDAPVDAAIIAPVDAPVDAAIIAPVDAVEPILSIAEQDANDKALDAMALSCGVTRQQLIDSPELLAMAVKLTQMEYSANRNKTSGEELQSILPTPNTDAGSNFLAMASKPNTVRTVLDNDGCEVVVRAAKHDTASNVGTSGETRKARHERLASELFGYHFDSLIGVSDGKAIAAGKRIQIADKVIDARVVNSGACYVCGGTHGADKGVITDGEQFGRMTRIVMNTDESKAALISASCWFKYFSVGPDGKMRKSYSN